jgi:hypothetical protein
MQCYAFGDQEEVISPFELQRRPEALSPGMIIVQKALLAHVVDIRGDFDRIRW